MFDVFTTMTSSISSWLRKQKKKSPTTKISDLTPQHFNKIRLLYTLERSKFEVLKSLNILDIILQIFFVPIFKCRYTYTVNKATSEQLQVIKCKEKEFCFLFLLRFQRFTSFTVSRWKMTLAYRRAFCSFLLICLNFNSILGLPSGKQVEGKKLLAN